jgi:hypothetical protein
MTGKRANRIRVVLAIVAATVILDLLAIATNVATAGPSKFPGPLRLIQKYPWPMVGVLSVLGLLCALWQARIGERDPKKVDQPAGVEVEQSRLNRSPISILKGTVARVRRSKLKDSPITIHDTHISANASQAGQVRQADHDKSESRG